MGFIFFFGLIFTTQAAVIYVPDDYSDIQEAVDGVFDNDSVIVRDGDYPDPVYVVDKSVYLASEHGPSLCHISRISIFGNANNSIIQGFTIISEDPSTLCYVQAPCFIDNCIFKGYSNVNIRGVAIYGGPVPIIENCQFENLNYYEGAALYSSNSDYPVIRNSEFRYCTATAAGGAIYVDKNASIKLENCTFSRNLSYYGSALFADTSSVLKIDDCRFYFNHAKITGGALAAFSSDSVHISASFFSNNYAGQTSTTLSAGGAIAFWESGSVVLEYSEFSRNYCTNDDGDLYGGAVFSYYVDDMSLNGVDFLNNSIQCDGVFSGNGGALCYIVGNSIDIRQCDFISNRITGSSAYSMIGGCLLDSPGQFNMEYCTFIDNSARSGGGIGLSTHDPMVESTITNTTFAKNGATDGGSGILVVAGTNLQIYNSIFADNILSNAIYLSGKTPLVGEISVGNFVNQGYDATIASRILIPFDKTAAATLNIECTNIFGNQTGDWVDDIASFADINNNLSVDPVFCDIAGNNVELYNTSPMLPSFNPCGVLIGSRGEGCELAYTCGDADNNSILNLLDLLFLIDYYFRSGPEPEIFYSGDVNSDGMINLIDIVFVSSHLFNNGPELNCL